jgi:hypothetical protein
MTKYILSLLIFTISSSFSQKNNLKSNQTSTKNIFLIGEAHFVKEKYDEIKAFTFEKINDLNKGDKVSFFFELPYTLNYAFNRFKEYGDTTVFLEWFNHLQGAKNDSVSYFWTDCRDMILELIDFADQKEIELEIVGIDTELEFRRTAFILSQFDYKVDNNIDSLLNLDYIKNDSLTRRLLLNQVDELSKISKSKIELNILETLKKSLTIDCTICLDRDQFMLTNFMRFYDSTTQLNFVSLGLDHIVSKHDFSKASSLFRMKYKIDTIGHQSFYELLNNDLKGQIWRVGILALNNKLKFANISKPRDYTELMNTKERDYIEKQLFDKGIYRVNLRNNKALTNLGEQLDYLIIYKVSHYRWR